MSDNAKIGRNPWSGLTGDQLFEKLKSSKDGLKTAEVLELRQEHGPNELGKEKRDSVLKIFFHEFLSPVVALLLIAAIACAIIGEYKETVIIAVIVIFNATLATWQAKSAGDALEKLAQMNCAKCKVLRDGKIEEIEAAMLVPGDIIELSTGDGVPADLRLIEAQELMANEALLTGESEDIKKVAHSDIEDKDEAFALNMCFMSTNITNGRAKGIITTTGMKTEVGKIADALKNAKQGSGLTPLQLALNRLGLYIGGLSICVLVLIVVIALLIGYKDPAHPDEEGFESIAKVAVGFAVSSVPEGLPMVVTICLALGCQDMVKRKALVVSLPSVETLGSCSVICSDKTGTLTEGKMTAMRATTFVRNKTDGDAQDFCFYPTKGFVPNGGLFYKSKLEADAKKQMDDMYTNSVETFGKSNFPEYGKVIKDYANPATVDWEAIATRSFMTAMFLNSHSTTLEYKQKEADEDWSKCWQPRGNMSEAALVVACAKMRIGVTKGSSDNEPDYGMLKELEVPFNSERKMQITVHVCRKAGMLENLKFPPGKEAASHFAVIKGAPDRILGMMPYNPEQDGVGVSMQNNVKRGAPDVAHIDKANESMATQALRVLAAGLYALTDSELQELKNNDTADGRMKWFKEKASATLLGLIGNADPPRPGVANAIETCRGAGIRVVMITGDQKPTAVAIAREIKLITATDDPNKKVLVCSELRDSSGNLRPDGEIDDICSSINVFSRAQPEDKIAIVHSLQRMQHVCGMTGDGVNDAPALKAADIGIAMGIAGTDVAKGAADMVLLDDNFCTIVAAIEEGRKIYANIQKFVSFLLGTNIGEVVYLAISIVAQLPVPLEALQIIFLNLMSDGCPAVALAKEPADPDIMKVKPRPKKSDIMTKHWWLFGNLPHVIWESVAVLCSLSLGLYLFTGQVTRPDIANLCEGPSFKYELPVYCVCHEFKAYDRQWVTHVNFFNFLHGEELGQRTYVGKFTKEEAFNEWKSGTKPLEVNEYEESNPLDNSDLVTKIGEVYCANDGFCNPTVQGTRLLNEAKNFDKVVDLVWGYNPKTKEDCKEAGKHKLVETGRRLAGKTAEGEAQRDGNGNLVYWLGGDDDNIGKEISECLTRTGQVEKANLAYTLKKQLDANHYPTKSCAAHGSKLGRAQAFITAVLCEMMRAYTVRCAPGDGTDPPWMWSVFNRNPMMHVACFISFAMTMLFTAVPYLKQVLSVTTPPFWSYCIAIVIPAMNAILDEITAKPPYKYFIIRPRKKADKALQAEQNGKLNTQAGSDTSVVAV